MADRPMVNQVVQIGPEVIAGLPVAATKRLQSLRLVPGVETTFVKVTPMGYIYPTVVSEGQEWTTLDATGVGAYTEMQYIMSSIFGKTGTGAGVQIGTTGAYTWTNQGGITTIDNAQTYTAEIGDANFAERVSNCLFTDWDLTCSRKAVDVKGKMIANLLDTGATLSVGGGVNEVQTVTLAGSPTGGTFVLTFNGETTAPIAHDALGAAVATALNLLADAQTTGFAVTGSAGGPYTVTFQNALAHDYFDPMIINDSLLTGGTAGSGSTVVVATPGSGAAPGAISIVPILPKEGNIYLDTTFGAIGTTQLTRDFMVTISLTGKSGPIWPIDRSQTSYAAVVGLEPKVSVKLQLQADAQGRAILAQLRDGQTFYVRLDYLSPTIAGGSGANAHRWTLDMCMKGDGIGKFADAEGVYVLDYTFQPVADPVAGFAFKSTLVNGQASL